MIIKLNLHQPFFFLSKIKIVEKRCFDYPEKLQ